MIKLPIWDHRNRSFISAWSSWCVCVDGLRLVLLLSPLESWRHVEGEGEVRWQLTLPCWDTCARLACGLPSEAECTLVQLVGSWPFHVEMPWYGLHEGGQVKLNARLVQLFGCLPFHVEIPMQGLHEGCRVLLNALLVQPLPVQQEQENAGLHLCIVKRWSAVSIECFEEKFEAEDDPISMNQQLRLWAVTSRKKWSFSYGWRLKQKLEVESL